MPKASASLPIYEVRPALSDAVRESKRFILSAPTGSGKSTQVPQMLLDDGLTGPGKIIVLQPRRMAARMLARRVAEERGGKLGGEIGYQVRLEGAQSKETRVLFITEGLLLRQMLDDETLSDVSAILFDEFHERHLYGDVTLAKAFELQQTLRPDLVLGVMSATLEIEGLKQFLAPCPLVESAGRAHPVDIRYSAAPKAVGEKPVWEQAAWHCANLIQEFPEGDVLIFMPGGFEIRKTIQSLESHRSTRECQCLPLYGELPPEQQDAAVSESSGRKIIVATNIAETSLTIPGVRLIVDSGLAKIPDYDPRRGIDTLLVRPISRASADQRAGRAGRTAPGHCLRMWGEREHQHRPEREAPEISRRDLAELALSLKALGYNDLEGFPWFEKPDATALKRAITLLDDLGALSTDGSLTRIGEQLSQFPLHPRYGRMFLHAIEVGCLEPVALIAALSQGRDIWLPIRDKKQDQQRMDAFEDEETVLCDHLLRLKAWNLASQNRFSADSCRQWGIHGLAARQAGQLAQRFIAQAKRLQGEQGATLPIAEGVRQSLFIGFADRLARRLDKGTTRCALVHGRRGELSRRSQVREPLFVATDIEERDLRGDVSVLLDGLSAVDETWLEAFFPEALNEGTRVFYDSREKRVRAVRERRFRDLVLQERDTDELPLDDAAAMLAKEIAEGRLELKQWTQKTEAWINRVNFMAQHFPEYEVAPITGEDRKMLLEQICHGSVTYKQVRDKPVMPVLQSWLSPEQAPLLDTCAPERMELPKGGARLRYEPDGSVILSTTVQRLYDVHETPLVGGRVPAKVELLAPNQRPIQITSDLASFWENGYPEVKKQLRGRYPKHEWR